MQPSFMDLRIISVKVLKRYVFIMNYGGVIAFAGVMFEKTKNRQDSVSCLPEINLQWQYDGRYLLLLSVLWER